MQLSEIIFILLNRISIFFTKLLVRLNNLLHCYYDSLDVDVMEEPFIDVDFMTKPMHTWDEVYDEMCKDIGKHYGLNDIMEAQ